MLSSRHQGLPGSICRPAPVALLELRLQRTHTPHTQVHSASLSFHARSGACRGAPVDLPLSALRVLARRADKARRVAVAVLVHHGRKGALRRRHARQQRPVQQAHLRGNRFADLSFCGHCARSRAYAPGRHYAREQRPARQPVCASSQVQFLQFPSYSCSLPPLAVLVASSSPRSCLTNTENRLSTSAPEAAGLYRSSWARAVHAATPGLKGTLHFA